MMKSLQLLVVLIGTVVGQEAGCAEQTTCEECAAYNRGSVSTALFISMVYCIEYFLYLSCLNSTRGKGSDAVTCNSLTGVALTLMCPQITIVFEAYANLYLHPYLQPKP